MNITFTDKEIEELKSQGKTRNTKDEGVVGRNFGVPAHTAHYYGVYSEAAVAKAFGIEYNKTHYPKGGDKHAADLVVPKVGNIEVKCVTEKYKSDPWLKVPVSDFNEDIDYYVLASTTFDTNQCHIEGYATKEMVKNAIQRRTRDTFPLNYELKKEDLLEFEDLIRMSKGLKVTPKVIVKPTPVATVTTTPSTKVGEVIYEAPVKKAKTGSLNLITTELQPGDVVSLKVKPSPSMVINTLHKDRASCLYFQGNDLIELNLPVRALVLST